MDLDGAYEAIDVLHIKTLAIEKDAHELANAERLFFEVTAAGAILFHQSSFLEVSRALLDYRVPTASRLPRRT